MKIYVVLQGHAGPFVMKTEAELLQTGIIWIAAFPDKIRAQAYVSLLNHQG